MKQIEYQQHDVIGISLSAMTIQRIADNQFWFRKKQYKSSATKNLDQLSSSKKVCRMVVELQSTPKLFGEAFWLGIAFLGNGDNAISNNRTFLNNWGEHADVSFFASRQ